jgi:L-lactate dehydrogenase complex protein LldG
VTEASTDSDRVDQFGAALERHEGTWSATPAADASAAIADLIEAPAVGSPIGLDGVSLPQTVEIDPSSAAVRAAQTGVTPAPFGVAAYGSIAVPGEVEHRALFPDRHVAVLAASAIETDVPAALARLGERARAGKDTVLATGPSSTADMGELVYGVHGPSEVHALVVTDR